MGYYSSTTDLTDRTDECPMAIKEIKKFVAFPRLTPLQPDAYGHPRKRASLSAPPHPSGLPAGRRKASNQNSCRWQYKMSLFGGYGRLPQTYGEPILWRTALQAEVSWCVMNPRAMPPVTQGSALQAPECLWSIIRGRIPSRGLVFIYVYRLAIDAKTLWGDDGAD